MKDVIRRVPGLAESAAALDAAMAMDAKLAAHKAYIREHGTDMPDIDGWQWGGRGSAPAGSAARDTAADNG